MVKEKKRILKESDIPRRRGRPAGKNRIPFSQEERRARNANYERERRNETAEVMSQLIQAANCDPSISKAELLATVINQIQRATRKKPEDITELERVNAKLEAQISTLQDRLRLDDAAIKLLDGKNSDTKTNGTYNSESQSTEESVTKFVATLSEQSQSIPSIERLTRSLIVVPPIVPPQQLPHPSTFAVGPDKSTKC